MTTHLRYCMITAHSIFGHTKHPQEVMNEIGITYLVATPQSLGDQWWFWCCEGVPRELPRFLSILHIDNAESAIGFGLSEEEAMAINKRCRENDE